MLVARYGRESVLERHHLAVFSELMASSEQLDVFVGWPAAEARRARATIAACLLATDMALHCTLLKELERRRDLHTGAALGAARFCLRGGGGGEGEGGSGERCYAPGVGLVYANSSEDGDEFEMSLSEFHPAPKG